jgi:hypothetical protein
MCEKLLASAHKCTNQVGLYNGCHDLLHSKVHHVPPRAPATAATPEHLRQVMAKAIGNTALPMKLPMARYTQPSEILSSKRMMERTPERQPQNTITIPACTRKKSVNDRVVDVFCLDGFPFRLIQGKKYATVLKVK